MSTKYLHTIDGKPAMYVSGEQICFRPFYGKAYPLADSLDQIRKEQRASNEWRKKQGFRSDGPEHGYVRIYV
jgi:hypothetical protein